MATSFQDNLSCIIEVMSAAGLPRLIVLPSELEHGVKARNNRMRELLQEHNSTIGTEQ